MIDKADQANTLVIINKDSYISKVKEFIDTDNCIEMKKDPTQNYQKLIKEITKHASFMFEGK